MIRLNIGCGNYPKPGWINCDKRGMYQQWEFKPIAEQIIELDLLQFPYRFADSSVDLITISHCLNQIDESHQSSIFRELCRILKPGGVLRITDDDVESAASPERGNLHFHALWPTGPRVIGEMLRAAGFRTHVVDKDLTLSGDRSILVSNHPEVPDLALFWIEGIKRSQPPEPLNQIAAHLQQSLADALRYFLYSSFARSRRGRLSSGWRQLDAEPLWHVIEAFSGLDGWTGHWPDQLPDTQISEETFARNLALAHRFWADVLEQEIRASTGATLLPRSKSYEAWRQQGGHARRYRTVDRLRRHLLAKPRNDFFLRAIVHGSVATLDDTPGFSDLDLAFVVRRATLIDPQMLIELRQLAAEVLTLTYAFDPFMHHCPYYISEIDLAWFPEAMFPLVLFQHAVDLLDGREEVNVWTRQSNDVTDGMLNLFEDVFRRWSENSMAAKDYYELEWVLGTAMLLPALYLQSRTGQFRYKRDTFPLAQRDFSPTEWEPIRKATEIRAVLAPRPIPPATLVALGVRLCAPGLIQWWARRHPRALQAAHEASQKLGTDYPQQVLRLLTTMREKLDKPPARASAERLPIQRLARCSSADVSIANHFDELAFGPFSDMPTLIARECYDAAVNLLLTRWTSLSQRPIAIYQLGQVAAPGISDLDFIIIVPIGQHIDWPAFQPQSFPKWVQEMFTHPPYICDTATWADLPAWYPTFNLKYLWGERLNIPTISKELQAGCALGMLVDYLLVKLPSDILRATWNRPCRVKILLCTLHSFKYTLRLAEQAGIAVPADAIQVIAQVDTLRASWFNLSETEQIAKLAFVSVRVCEAIGMLIAETDTSISQRTNFGNNVHSLIELKSANNYRFCFDSNWTLEHSLQIASEQFSSTGHFSWPCPLSFAQVLAIYADECSAFGDYFRALHISTRIQWDGDRWSKGLRFHARAMIAYADSARSLGVPAQPYVALGFSFVPTLFERARRFVLSVASGEIGLREACRMIVKKALGFSFVLAQSKRARRFALSVARGEIGLREAGRKIVKKVRVVTSKAKT